uniref:Uncharacterized protein n=1 Tax=Panagrolaimus davidi TaxID=227884 RepID=A0A914QUC4_9BILA
MLSFKDRKFKFKSNLQISLIVLIMGGGNDDNNGGNGGGSGKQGFASMPKEQVSEIGKMGAEARKEKYGLQDHTGEKNNKD